MPRPFYQATAEQVVIVSEAVVSLGGGDVAAISGFADLPVETAESALMLSVDLGLIMKNAEQYLASNPMCKLLRTPQDSEKAAILRVIIESYEPFQIFREEHEATNSVNDAAQRTLTKMGISAHREHVKETLLSLATYSGAMTAGQGNTYERDARGLTAILQELAAGSREQAEATLTIRSELGEVVGQVDHDQVITPLVAGLRHAAANNGREAVLQAGIAVESFLALTAAHHGTDITSANGINAKMDRLTNAGHYPRKLMNVCKYVGHVRNAADHGVDAEIQAPWDISAQTGRNYVFVSVMLIKSMLAHRAGGHEI